EIYTLSLHDALPISVRQGCRHVSGGLAVEQTETGCVSVSWRGCGRVGYSGVMAKVNDPQEQAASRRDRRLRAWPHWDDHLCHHRSEEHTSELQSRSE